MSATRRCGRMPGRFTGACLTPRPTFVSCGKNPVATVATPAATLAAPEAVFEAARAASVAARTPATVPETACTAPTTALCTAFMTSTGVGGRDPLWGAFGTGLISARAGGTLAGWLEPRPVGIGTVGRYDNGGEAVAGIGERPGGAALGGLGAGCASISSCKPAACSAAVSVVAIPCVIRDPRGCKRRPSRAARPVRETPLAAGGEEAEAMNARPSRPCPDRNGQAKLPLLSVFSANLSKDEIARSATGSAARGAVRFSTRRSATDLAGDLPYTDSTGNFRGEAMVKHSQKDVQRGAGLRLFKAGIQVGAISGAATALFGPRVLRWLAHRAALRFQRALPQRLRRRLEHTPAAASAPAPTQGGAEVAAAAVAQVQPAPGAASPVPQAAKHQAPLGTLPRLFGLATALGTTRRGRIGLATAGLTLGAVAAIGVWQLRKRAQQAAKQASERAPAAAGSAATTGTSAAAAAGSGATNVATAVKAATENAVSQVPVSTKPQVAKPESAKPESAKPQVAKPEPAKPEPAKPESAKPESAKPQAAGLGSSAPGDRLEAQLATALNSAFSRLGLGLHATSKRS